MTRPGLVAVEELADLDARELRRELRRAHRLLARREQQLARLRAPRRKRATRSTSTAEALAMIRRLLVARGAAIADEDPEQLAELSAIGEAVEAACRVAVAGIRRNHADAAIGEALGVTRQAVQKRFPRDGESLRR